jgi:hypothetical protein
VKRNMKLGRYTKSLNTEYIHIVTQAYLLLVNEKFGTCSAQWADETCRYFQFVRRIFVPETTTQKSPVVLTPESLVVVNPQTQLNNFKVVL